MRGYTGFKVTKRMKQARDKYEKKEAERAAYQRERDLIKHRFSVFLPGIVPRRDIAKLRGRLVRRDFITLQRRPNVYTYLNTYQWLTRWKETGENEDRWKSLERGLRSTWKKLTEDEHKVVSSAIEMLGLGARIRWTEPGE